MKQISINLQNHKKQVFCSFFFLAEESKRNQVSLIEALRLFTHHSCLVGKQWNATESPCYPVLVLEIFGELCGGLKSLQELGCSSVVYRLSSLQKGLFLNPSTGKKNEPRNRLNQLWGKAFTIAQWWRTLTLSSSRESRFESQLRTVYNFLYLQF